MNVSLPILWPICEPCILEEKKEMITYYQKNREKILDKYYEKKEQKITFIELYHKSDKENEDRQRIIDNFK